MRLYLAGPMTNKPMFNFPEFHRVAKLLREAGYDVFNPAEYDEQHGFDPSKDQPKPLKHYMEHDLAELCRCDGLALLDGWSLSEGADIEVTVATKLDIGVASYHAWLTDAESCPKQEYDDNGMFVHHVQPTTQIVKVIPDDAAKRKEYPLYRGCLQYFPDALAVVANVSHGGNAQHHPDKPLHWDKSKSKDEPDALVRHMLEGDRAKVAWRALAWLQRGLDTGEYKYKPEGV